MPTAPLEGFTKLDDITSIYHPPECTKLSAETKSKAPCLIVICSWMGAAPKHIFKYIDGYRHLCPTASILLIESTLSRMFIGSDLTAACEIINSFVKNESSQSNSGTGPHAVLHCYSNGGANNAVWLAECLLKTHDVLPFDNMILDCCPGQPEVESATRAITLSLPNQYLIRLLGSYLIYLALLISKFVDKSFRLENTIIRIRRQLNDSAVFPRTMPRLYLYSEGDAMVDFPDVHDHAEEARESGYSSVKEEKFLKAPHCALLNEDSQRYWDALEAHVLGSDDKLTYM